VRHSNEKEDKNCLAGLEWDFFGSPQLSTRKDTQ